MMAFLTLSLEALRSPEICVTLRARTKGCSKRGALAWTNRPSVGRHAAATPLCYDVADRPQRPRGWLIASDPGLIYGLIAASKPSLARHFAGRISTQEESPSTVGGEVAGSRIRHVPTANPATLVCGF